MHASRVAARGLRGEDREWKCLPELVFQGVSLRQRARLAARGEPVSVVANDDGRDDAQALGYSASSRGSPPMCSNPLSTQMKRFDGSESKAGTAKSFGGAGGTRTLYLFNAIEALSQMSYSPTQYGPGP